jgi:hypothetical protein
MIFNMMAINMPSLEGLDVLSTYLQLSEINGYIIEREESDCLTRKFVVWWSWVFSIG